MSDWKPTRPRWVWSGSLKGVRVDSTETSFEAVDQAVRANLPCALGIAIRVSIIPQGTHPMDVFFGPPYEELFPDLFDGTIDVQMVCAGETE